MDAEGDAVKVSVTEGRENLSIENYESPWPSYGIAWGLGDSETDPCGFAVSSYRLDYKNYIRLYGMGEYGKLLPQRMFDHCYPPTKIMFTPNLRTDNLLMITTADYLRIWRGLSLPGYRGEVSIHVFKTGGSDCTPITSCDWNKYDAFMIGCCGIDRVVTIWDLVEMKIATRVFASERDVYDIGFNSPHTFATCSADGSVRLCDLRCMDRSTILYESPRCSIPLVRLAWNPHYSNYFSTFGLARNEAVVIDVRCPKTPLSVLSGCHTAPINAMAWSPRAPQHICTVGEDGLISISNANNGRVVFQHQFSEKINNVAWNYHEKDSIAITTDNGVQVLRLKAGTI